jgi:hypothetical protein
MSAYVKVFGCRPGPHDGRRHAHLASLGPASENLQGRKPRWGYVGGAAGYGDLSARQRFETRRFSTGVSLESVHNLDGTARILLKGESNFRAACDFKGLHVAKRAHSATSALSASRRPFSHIERTRALRDFKNLDSVQRNCFELPVKMITASPDCKGSSSDPGGADGAMLGIDAILPVVWPRSWSACWTDRLVRDEGWSCVE